MKIAITSGKGGVGKTFVATCLADVFAEDRAISLIDCDVEAANAHLFLKADEISVKAEFLPCVESIDLAKCNHCGLCAETCYFNALAVGKKSAMTFPELCRWCGACQIVCPQQALVIGQRKIGDLYSGQIGNIDLHWGKLQTGAGGMTTKLIDTLKSRQTRDLVIYDSPPGTSCPVVHTVHDADSVVLVSDPSRFGLHDLKLSVRMCRSMDIEPCVIVNRAEIGDLEMLQRWCLEQQLEVLGMIGDLREIAEYYSAGALATAYLPEVKKIFAEIADKLLKRESAPCDLNSYNSESVYLSEILSDDSMSDSDEDGGYSTKAPEVLVISGKGGSGKTSLSACFVQLANSTAADCDVDAADMHLLFKPEVAACDDFLGGRVMSIDPEKCMGCGKCYESCRFEAIEKTEDQKYTVKDGCEGCGVCIQVCPAGAVNTEPSLDGRWYLSSIRYGRMSHATLSPGRENSGKMVTQVRKNAERLNTHSDSEEKLIVLDGSPGTGCPVIASIGGVEYAVLVAEPTVSGMHDLRRIYELAQHFHVPCGIVINKADINYEVSDAIEMFAQQHRLEILGRLSYSTVFNEAQQAGQTVLEYSPESEISKNILSIWERIKGIIKERLI